MLNTLAGNGQELNRFRYSSAETAAGRLLTVKPREEPQEPLDTMAKRVAWVVWRSGLSMSALSTKAGIKSRQHVSMLVSGAVGEGVTGKTIGKIAAFTGVSARWIQFGEGPRFDELTITLDDPYPARTEAIASYRNVKDPLIKKVVEAIASIDHKSEPGSERWDVVEWSEEITRRIRKAQRDAALPGHVEARQADSNRKLDAVEAEQPKMPAREAAKPKGGKP